MANPKRWSGARRAVRTLLVLIGLTLAACAPRIASTPDPSVSKEVSTASLPPGERAPTRKIGDPYQINGVWYFPHEDPKYDETGLASWYGSDFHGRPTANGEYYDMHGVSAAHKTLPLPSWVYVTNLDNGRGLMVRVNDRGPFANGRIIDLSRGAADQLGMRAQGVAKVRVQLVPEQQVASLEASVAPAAGPPRPARGAPSAASGSERSRPAAQGESASAATIPKPAVRPGNPIAVAALPPPTAAPASVAPAAEIAPALPALATRSLPIDGRNPIFVQVGAFSFKENAERLKSTLARHGRVSVEPVRQSGRTLYRVRIGPIAKVEAADRTLERMIAAGHTNARIVVECARGTC